MKILSWNVNGIRAAEKKGIIDWLEKESPDVLAIQETKAHPQQLSNNLLNPEGYFSYFSSAEKKGYSGVCIYSKQKPIKVGYGLGKKEFDNEGRTVFAEYEKFVLYNIYFPNGKASKERLKFKLDFYKCFIKVIERYIKENGKQVIVCGDFNTAHKEIDLSRPKENSTVSGFLPEERKLIDNLISAGMVDSFRVFNQEPNNYTWWDLKTRARERNIGWRIDYFFINEKASKNLKDAFIMPQVFGSDHCPLGITLKF